MKKNILLIDDNKYLLDVFVIRLSMCLKNYRILTAQNGRKGVAVLNSSPVDFALTDLDMPEMDGYDFIAYARKHFPSVPVYAMSSDCTEVVAGRLRSLGITECIEKPFLVEEVMHKIIRGPQGGEQADRWRAVVMDECLLSSTLNWREP